MINALINYHSNKIVSVKISGHSGYSEYGSDIICSAVSSVAECIGNGITEILKVKCIADRKSGFFIIDISKCSDCDIDRCQVLFETFLLELKNIELGYKKHIKVTVGEV